MPELPKSSRHVEYAEGRSALVLSMPHSATDIPAGIKHNLNLKNPDVRKTLNFGVDLSVPHVTGFHEYASAARIWTNIPRVVLDPNRLVEQADKHAVIGGSRNLDAHGMIWRSTVSESAKKIRPTLTRPYTKPEFERLLRQGYFPFVDAIKTAMNKAVARHGIAIHFQLHSMPGHLLSNVKKGRHKNAYLVGKRMERGRLREGKYPDLLIVDQGDKACSPKIIDLVISTFSKHGLLVERMPFRPGTASPHGPFGNPSKGLHTMGIEIVGHTFEPNRKKGELYYNPAEQKKFRKAFHSVFKALESLRPENV